jgi:endonuclease/exonuclease/phosphatase family metal-dependent hydrolase
MKIIKHPHLTSLALLLLSVINSNFANAKSLRVVTWNTEHLAAHNGKGCKARDTESYTQMRQYAQSLDADVIALQEVDSLAAVERIFPDSQWQIIMSSRTDSPSYTCRENKQASTQQKVAFVVRKPILIKQVNHLSELAKAKVGAREAIHLQIEQAGKPLNLLNVHMKSGCFVENYEVSNKSNCAIYAKQAEYLKSYLAQQNLARENWFILGDFNHHLTATDNHFRVELLAASDYKNKKDYSDGSPLIAANNLFIATDGVVGCHPKYPLPIDHIVISASMRRALVPSSVKFHNYNTDHMLSDHCALSAQFNF